MNTRSRIAERYAILYDVPEGSFREKLLSGMRTKHIRAGDTLEIECYPILRHWSEQAKRELKRRTTGRAQQELNLRNSKTRLRRLMEHNFTETDLFLTLTFDYGFADAGFYSRRELLEEYARNGYPANDAEARRFVVNLLRRIRRRVRQISKEEELRYIYVIESTKEPRDSDPEPLPPRYHFHLVISAPGLTREDIEACWDMGYAQTRKLDFRTNGLEGLAEYISKQRGFLRRWQGSRNLKQPEERISDRAVSRRRAAEVARDVQAYGRELFERLYPDYRCEAVPVVKYSDFVAGAYIYARMRKRTEKRGIDRK